MTHGLLDVVRAAMSSPWVYLAVVALTWLDGVVPAVPGETAVITAGVFSAAGRPNVSLVVLAATVGAAAGDHTSYGLGYRFRARASSWAGRRDRRGRALRWARGTLERHGGPLIVAARFVPCGRTAVSLTAGATGYGLRRFSPFTVLAALSWAVYGTALGYLGGAAFANRPWYGLAVGLGLAFAVTTMARISRISRCAGPGA